MKTKIISIAMFVLLVICLSIVPANCAINSKNSEISNFYFLQTGTNATDIVTQINMFLRNYTVPIGNTLLNMTNSLNITIITQIITFFFIDQPIMLVIGTVIIVIAIVVFEEKKS